MITMKELREAWAKHFQASWPPRFEAAPEHSQPELSVDLVVNESALAVVNALLEAELLQIHAELTAKLERSRAATRFGIAEALMLIEKHLEEVQKS